MSLVRPSSAFDVRTRSAQGCHLVDASLRGFLTSRECGDGFVSTCCHLETARCMIAARDTVTHPLQAVKLLLSYLAREHPVLELVVLSQLRLFDHD